MTMAASKLLIQKQTKKGGQVNVFDLNNLVQEAIKRLELASSSVVLVPNRSDGE